MVGDTSDYVKLVNLVKKKVREIICDKFFFLSDIRKLSRRRHLNSLLGPGTRAKKMARTLMTIRKFVVATWVYLSWMHSHMKLTPLQNVTKGAIVECVKSGIADMDDLKSKTKAGTGCGGCMPLITKIFKVCS